MISIEKRKWGIDTYYLYVFFIVVLTFINSQFARISQITALLAMAETVYLIYALLGRSISDFTIRALIILSTNIESIGFALGDRTAVFYSVYISSFYEKAGRASQILFFKYLYVLHGSADDVYNLYA